MLHFQLAGLDLQQLGLLPDQCLLVGGLLLERADLFSLGTEGQESEDGGDDREGR